MIFKSERNSLKRNETLLNGKRIENVKEYEILCERNEIEDKYKKSSDFKEQKSNLLLAKRNLAIDLSSKRQTLLSKFDEITEIESIQVKYFIFF